MLAFAQSRGNVAMSAGEKPISAPIDSSRKNNADEMMAKSVWQRQHSHRLPITSRKLTPCEKVVSWFVLVAQLQSCVPFVVFREERRFMDDTMNPAEVIEVGADEERRRCDGDEVE